MSCHIIFTCCHVACNLLLLHISSDPIRIPVRQCRFCSQFYSWKTFEMSSLSLLSALPLTVSWCMIEYLLTHLPNVSHLIVHSWLARSLWSITLIKAKIVSLISNISTKRVNVITSHRLVTVDMFYILITASYDL